MGHNRRFLPALVEMEKMITEYKIGKVLDIEGQHSGPSGYHFKAGSWRANRVENPAGGMAPRGVHALDSMIHLCGVVRSFFCMSERREISVDLDDTTSALVRFKTGATGYLATIIATANFWRLHMFGTKGWIEMNGPGSLTIKNLEDNVVQQQFDDFDIQKAELEAFAEAVDNKKSFLFPPEEAINGIAVIEAMVETAKIGSVVVVE